METFFMNTKNSKNNEPNRFKYHLIDKLDLKNTNKNIALGNLHVKSKMLSQLIITISSKYQHQLGMKYFICLMDCII